MRGLSRSERKRGRWAAWLGLALVIQACSLDESDLIAFRDTATGPEKLRAVLRDGTRPARLRAHAALDLLDLEQRDLDGRAALFQDLGKLDARGRNDIVPSFKVGLLTRMRTERHQVPSATALRAKDAGVELLPMLGERERELLGTELLDWMLEDLDVRADQGTYTLEEVAARIGPGSAPVVLEALSADLSPKNLSRLLALVDAHADAKARAATATRLVQVEQTFRDPRQRRAVEAQLLSEGAFAAGTDASLIDAQVSARIEHMLKSRLLPALGQFSDQAAARERLLAIAQDSRLTQAERSQAFSLLEGRIQGGDVSALLKAALDDKTPISLREVMLTRAGETRSREIVPSLLVLVGDRVHQSLRQRAGELLLEIGGPQSLQSFFRALPNQWDMAYPRSELDAYSERINRFPAENALLLMLGEKMHSVHWWNRIMALRYFAVHGTAEDAWRIRQHLEDTHLVMGDGWPTEYTVGQEAEAALAVLMERFRKPRPAPATVGDSQP